MSVDLGHRYLLIETFMSTTLVELKIGRGCHINLRPGHISLPMLKTLTLADLVRSDSDQLQRLLSACPALEALNLANVHWSYLNVTVSSASLKTLTIDSANNFLRAFSFDTPNLLCLKYSKLVAWNYPLVNSENLVEAHIKLVLTDGQLLENNNFLGVGKGQKLVRGICSVQKLYLSPGTLQVLCLCSQAFPVFNNLTFLDIESSMDLSWQAMPLLLKNCPHLETLVIMVVSYTVSQITVGTLVSAFLGRRKAVRSHLVR